MTPKRERDLGKAFMRSVRRSGKVMDDPLLTDYIQSLGQRLIKDSTAHGTPFTFFVVDDPQINAFAGPVDISGVQRLILTTETESELAAVLAHEIAHVTQQHLLRAWESTGQMSVPSVAVLLAAIVLGGGHWRRCRRRRPSVVRRRLSSSRSTSPVATNRRPTVSVSTSSPKSGYEPRAMPSFFERMGKANRDMYASKLPEF